MCVGGGGGVGGIALTFQDFQRLWVEIQKNSRSWRAPSLLLTGSGKGRNWNSV